MSHFPYILRVFGAPKIKMKKVKKITGQNRAIRCILADLFFNGVANYESSQFSATHL